MKIRTGLGQDSHRFLPEDSSKPCVLGGIIFENVAGFNANSDGDVIFHAICNAISSVTGTLILGNIADELFEKDGITDSRVYLDEALKSLGSQRISHLALSIEAARPKILPKIEALRTSIADALHIEISQVGITATSGEGLTDFGCGDGLQCLALLTTIEV